MKKVLLFLALVAFLLIAFVIYFVYQSATMMRQEQITIPPIEEITSIEDIVTPYLANNKTKALSIGIFKHGKITYSNFGISSTKQPTLPSNNSIYEIGSITKTFTTAVLAQMVQEGKVNLADPISKFLPAKSINWSTDTINITLEELATHQSGLPRLPDNIMKRMFFNMDNPYKNYSMEDLGDFLKTYTPIPKTDRKVEYSNLGVGLLGNILATVDTVHFLKTMGTTPPVIFTTAYPKYALDGYQFDVIDYLLKPISFERFLQACNKALRLTTPTTSNTTEEDSYIFVKTDKQLVKLNIADILYIEGLQNYILFHTPKEKIMALVPMKNTFELLSSEDFIQIHKSYIVAKNKVEAIIGNQVVIHNQKLPISTRMRKEVLGRLTGKRLLKK